MLSGVGLSAAIGSSGISSRCFCARIGIESRHIGLIDGVAFRSQLI